ncbi:hypothetical protein [Burkholderia gladioli]|uniref:hypothetical protein n=1 Tax=Burkholderia gladioli TaxID=28095 RepID=UPI0021B48EF2|nr:hypothetical protein [Burkholderia gladioli]
MPYSDSVSRYIIYLAFLRMRKTSSRGRRPLTKAKLLPIPAGELRRIQFKHHVALAALHDIDEGIAQLATLVNAIYMAYLLDPNDPVPYRQAETALLDYSHRAERGEPGMLTDFERAAVEHVVARLDAALAAVPMYRYVRTIKKLQHMTMDDSIESPIPRE